MSHDADTAGEPGAGAPGPDIGCRNLAWALALLEGMVAAGMRALVISPGARSTPLVIAGQRLERAGSVQLFPILDERSAGFFALGLARASLRPVGLVATSGSAPAHWYPAVIEAAESGLPLLLLSADRPPRLHGWGANQTIDQTRLFGAFVREFHDPGLPQGGASALKSQRALGRRAAQVSQGQRRGPVHINLPFDEPLVPAGACSELSMLESIPGAVADAAVSADRAPAPAGPVRISARLSSWPAGRGLIVCGPGAEQATAASRADRETSAESPAESLAESVWRCADRLALPVLVDPLSGLRTGKGSKARVSAYDAILRNQEAARALRPDWVLRVGTAPVSKRLGEWLQGIPSVLVSPGGRWSDPGQDALIQLELPVAAVCDALVDQGLVTPDPTWLARWCGAEQRAWALLEASLSESAEGSAQGPLAWGEGHAIQALRCAMPDQEALLCANSMPIRQLDTWWRGGGAQVALLGNRGASGIDGYLSTLAGLAQAGLRCWGLTGDLSFCHDLSGLLLAARLDRPLLVLNNNGGHIFDYLPQRGLEGLERFWHTPQPVQIQALAQTAGIAHVRAEDGASLGRALTELGGGPGIIEVRIDPEVSRRSHLELWARIAQARLVDR